MERVNAICRHALWRESVDEIARLEQDRVFCRHDRAHLLDVARLAYMENLEQGLGVDKELIYAAALLHDIGRHLQYTKNIPHDEAGAQLAEIIMADCGFSPAEREEVAQAILQHRGGGEPVAGRIGSAALPGGQGFARVPFLRGGAGVQLEPRKEKYDNTSLRSRL